MKVGIIGYGLMGKRRRDVLPAEDVVVTADVRDPIGPACDCDATIISVPTPSLHAVCLDALSNGARRILLEKPCGTSSAAVREIAGRAEECGAIVVPAYTLRHYPGVIAAWTDARYGKLLWLSAQYGHGGGATGWRAHSGELLDQGSHLLDLAQWFDHCGITSATTARIETQYVEDHVNITYGHHTLMASWAMWKPTFRLALYYEGGSCLVTGLGGPYGDHCGEWRDRGGHVDEVRNYFDARTRALREEWDWFTRVQDNRHFQRAIRVQDLIEEARRCAS
jgi:predicted dehydrogenase